MKVIATLLAIVALGLSSCDLASQAPPAAPPVAVPSTAEPDGSPSPPTGECRPTDQDQYVYHPARLQVVNPCLRVTGTVLVAKSEADGDLHIRVQLDAAYLNLLTPANQQQCAQGICGLLVVEPLCERPVTQADAVASCAADHDPLASLPPVGAHVSLEGRYVLDTEHDSWAELHPLYAWDLAP